MPFDEKDRLPDVYKPTIHLTITPNELPPGSGAPGVMPPPTSPPGMSYPHFPSAPGTSDQPVVPPPAEGTPMPESPGQLPPQEKDANLPEKLLKMLTGMDANEWSERIRQGTLPSAMGKVGDPIGNIARAITLEANKRMGSVPEPLAEQLAGSAALVASMLWGAQGSAKDPHKMAEVSEALKQWKALNKEVEGLQLGLKVAPEVFDAAPSIARRVQDIAKSTEAQALREWVKLHPEVMKGVQEAVETSGPAKGMTRLYRSELPEGRGPYGISGNEKGLGKLPPGKFYTTDKEAAGFYKGDMKGGQTNYIDLETEVAERFRLPDPDVFGIPPAGGGVASKIPQYVIPHSLGFRRTPLDETGRINTATALLLGRIVTGASAGVFMGDTFEDKIRNGLIGAGLGAAITPGLVKSLAKAVRPSTGRWNVPTSFAGKDIKTGVEAFAQAADTPLTIGTRNLGVTWRELDDPEKLMETYRKLVNFNKEAVEAAKGGVQSDATRQSMAKELGMSVEDLFYREPGAAATDLEIYTAKQMAANAIASMLKTREMMQGLPVGSEPYNALRDIMAVQLNAAGILSTQVSNMGTAWGRAGRALAGSEEMDKIRKVITGFTSGALPPESAAQAIAQLQRPAQQMNWLRWLYTYGPQVASAAYVSSLLMTGKAMFVKFASELQATGYMSVERLIHGGLDHLRGLPPGERVYASEFMSGISGSVHSFNMALQAAAKHLRDGVSMPFAEGGHMTAIEAAAPSAPFPKAVEWLGKLATIPSRPLGADTAFFRVMNFNRELYALARREVEDQVGRGILRRADAREKFEYYLEHPTEPMVHKSIEAAEISTFTDPLVGFMRSVQGATIDHPSIRFAIPFYKIATNLSRFNWERFPVLGLMARRNREILMNGTKSDVDGVLAKQAMGSMVALTAYELAKAGRLRGRGPTNADVRREDQVDYVPYSFKVGDTWYGLDRISEPLRSTIGFFADLVQIAGEAAPDDYMQAAVAGVLAFQENLISKTFLQDLNTFSKAVMDQNPGALKALLKTERGVVTSGLAPPLSQQIRRSTDPKQREAYDLLDHIMDRIPGFSKSLWPRVRLDGEDGVYDPFWGPGVISPILMKQENPDAVRREIVKNNIAIPLPPAVIEGSRAPQLGPVDFKTGINLEEYPDLLYKYRKMAGKALKLDAEQLKRALGDISPQPIPLNQGAAKWGMWEAMHALIKSDIYKKGVEGDESTGDGPHGRKARLMDIIVHAYRNAAKNVLIWGTGGAEGVTVPEGWGKGDAMLQQLVIEKQLEKAESMAGPRTRQRLEQQMKERGLSISIDPKTGVVR